MSIRLLPFCALLISDTPSLIASDRANWSLSKAAEIRAWRRLIWDKESFICSLVSGQLSALPYLLNPLAGFNKVAIWPSVRLNWSSGPPSLSKERRPRNQGSVWFAISARHWRSVRSSALIYIQYWLELLNIEYWSFNIQYQYEKCQYSIYWILKNIYIYSKNI